MEKWKKIELRELLNCIEFDYEIGKDENGKRCIRLIDMQGANLGDIGSEEFDNVEQIIDRCEAYWLDYGMDYVEEFADSLGINWTTWEDIFKDLEIKGLVVPNKTYYTQAELQAKGYDTSGIDNPSDGLEVWLLYYLTHPNMVIVPEMKRRKRTKRAA